MAYKSRKEAKENGATQYFTGKPCPKNHIANRMTSNGRCCECLKEDKIKRRKENPEQHRKYMRMWHEKNKDSELEYRNKNKQRISENSKRWASENPIRVSENARNWRLRNLERCNENRRRWRKANPERERFLAKRWRMRNPEKQREIMFNRNCATRGVRGAISRGLIQELMISQESKCNYCRINISGRFDVDHKIPVSRGGSNEDQNLQLLCIRCNRSKRDKTHEEFVEWLKRRRDEA